MAIKLDPKYARGYRIRADTYRDKGDYERAIADHTEAIRFDPKAVNLYFARGRMNFTLARCLRQRLISTRQATSIPNMPTRHCG